MGLQMPFQVGLERIAPITVSLWTSGGTIEERGETMQHNQQAPHQNLNMCKRQITVKEMQRIKKVVRNQIDV